MRRRARFLRALKKHRLAATVLVAMLAASSTYAYTNTINLSAPPSLASGSGAIGKFEVGSPSFQLNLGNNPNLVLSVSFTVSGSPTSVQAQLDGNWYACSGSGTYTCDTPGVLASTIFGQQIAVVATG